MNPQRWPPVKKALLAASSLFFLLACLTISALGGPAQTPAPSNEAPTPTPPEPANTPAFEESSFPAPPTDTPTVEASLSIENHLADDVCFLYIAGDGIDGWGENLVAEGGSLTFRESADSVTLTGGVYDLKAEDCDHNVVAWAYALNVPVGSITFVLEPADTLLTVINQSNSPICGFRMQPSHLEQWGERSLLDMDHPIQPGDSRDFAIPYGAQTHWNLLAESCTGVKIERRDIEISGRRQTWLIVD